MAISEAGGWSALLADLEPQVAEDMRGVQRVIDGVASDAPDPLAEPVAHALGGPGKRVRPLVSILCFGACRGPERERVGAVRSAAAVELVHTATLLVDDVFDGNPLRRGRPSVGARFGRRTAVLAAGVLTARAFELAAPRTGRGLSRGRDDVEEALAGFERLLEGEARAIELGSDGATRETWEEIALGKTGSLFELAASLGARRAGAEGLAEALRAYGRSLGVAFQAVDDVLDVVGDPDRTGKPTGLDESSPNVARRFGVQAAREIAREWAQEAVQALEPVPDGPCRDGLVRLADDVVGRRA